MKAKSLALYFILFTFFISSCYVSNIETFIKKEYPIKDKMLIVSLADERNESYIKDLSYKLNKKLTNQGYEVKEYVSERYDSLYFNNLLKNFNPKTVFLITPQNKFVEYSDGFLQLTYDLVLYHRLDSIQDQLLYKGLIKIAYRYDKKLEIVETTVGKIMQSVFPESKTKVK